MAFERLTQQMETEEVAKQQRQLAKQKADRAAEQPRIEAERQRETIAKAESDRSIIRRKIPNS